MAAQHPMNSEPGIAMDEPKYGTAITNSVDEVEAGRERNLRNRVNLIAADQHDMTRLGRSQELNVCLTGGGFPREYCCEFGADGSGA